MTFYFSVMLMAVSYTLTSNTFIYHGVYGFSIKQIALTSFAPLIAVWFAIPYCGFLNDWFITRLRHRGDFLPEWRLSFFLPTIILGPVGCVIVGVCAQNHSHWVVPLIGEAFGMFTVQVTRLAVLTMIKSHVLFRHGQQSYADIFD
jgi:hypothetical protein